MKKALKIVACLLMMMTVALGMNVSNATARTLCDYSASPTCIAELFPGECQEVPLPGYALKSVEIEFAGGPLPLPYPPPTVNYTLENGFTQVKGKLLPDVTAEYEWDSATPDPGKVCNVEDRSFPLPLKLVWKNVPEYLD